MPFVRGQSGNPGGRPKALKAVEEAAKEHTTMAIERLVSVALDPTAPHAATVSACVALLDRAWGKPRQQLDANVNAVGDLGAAMAAARARVKEGT